MEGGGQRERASGTVSNGFLHIGNVWLVCGPSSRSLASFAPKTMKSATLGAVKSYKPYEGP